MSNPKSNRLQRLHVEDIVEASKFLSNHPRCETLGPNFPRTNILRALVQ